MIFQKPQTTIIQGITGKEGQRILEAMQTYTTQITAGVRPGKGGEVVSGVPVYNTVSEVVEVHGAIDVSIISVPPLAAADAMLEAIAAGVKTICVLVERIPMQDVVRVFEVLKDSESRIVGPSSLGYIVPGSFRVGLIGGDRAQTDEIYVPGTIGIISRSGGMANELAWQFRAAGCGQRFVMHIGGDALIGTAYADILRMCEPDAGTRAVAIFGEHGGSYEYDIISCIENKEWTKPLAVYIGGGFAERFPVGMAIGHAGAIVEKGKSAENKKQRLREVGVHIAETPRDLVRLLLPYCS